MSNKECIELKNIKYKSMLLNSNFNNQKEMNESNNIDEFLDKEKQMNKDEHWTRLDKTIKLQKIKKFVEDYSKEQNLSNKDSKNLFTFLSTCLDQKKLGKTKDVNYDRSSGLIKSIPCLSFNLAQKKFTLKRCEKRQSTLKSLAPKKNNKTRDNKKKSGTSSLPTSGNNSETEY